MPLHCNRISDGCRDLKQENIATPFGQVFL